MGQKRGPNQNSSSEESQLHSTPPRSSPSESHATQPSSSDESTQAERRAVLPLQSALRACPPPPRRVHTGQARNRRAVDHGLQAGENAGLHKARGSARIADRCVQPAQDC